METFRRRRGAAAHRDDTGSRQPMGADHVRAHAETARGRARPKYDVSSLKSAIHAAAPCPIEVKRKMIEWWGPVIHEYYAGTEGNGFCFIDLAGMAGASGHRSARRCSAKSRSATKTGEELPIGEEGVIYFAGAAGVRISQRSRKDGAIAQRNTAGRRSATSASSTRTAISI